MRFVCLLLVCFTCSTRCISQNYSDFTTTVSKFYQSTSPEQTDKLWNDLVESEGVPLVIEDSVAFFYRGDANSVVWMGDFNGWGYSKDFNNKGKRIPGTDIWILKATFPKDARLDYKILINDTN